MRESLGTVSFKEGLSVFLSMLSQRLHKKDMFIAEKGGLVFIPDLHFVKDFP